MNVPEVIEGEFACVGGGKRAGLLAEIMGGIEENPFVPVNPEVCCVYLHSLSPHLLPVLCFEGGCTLPLPLAFWGYFFHLISCICSAAFLVLLFVSLLVSSPLLYILLLPEKPRAAVCEGEALRLAMSLCTSTPTYTS